jgi:hypothetical protein
MAEGCVSVRRCESEFQSANGEAAGVIDVDVADRNWPTLRHRKVRHLRQRASTRQRVVNRITAPPLFASLKVTASDGPTL